MIISRKKSFMKNFKCVVASWVIASVAFAGLPVTAQAGMVSTDQVLATTDSSSSSAGRDRIHAFLAREDVRNALQAQGVSAEAAVSRVQAMSDAEVAQLANRVDQAPAGGEIVGVLFTVFIILLITDIFGLTKVFPFTRSIR
jgi:hypothetical protein